MKGCPQQATLIHEANLLWRLCTRRAGLILVCVVAVAFA